VVVIAADDAAHVPARKSWQDRRVTLHDRALDLANRDRGIARIFGDA
jgi:hypothetical protein